MQKHVIIVFLAIALALMFISYSQTAVHASYYENYYSSDPPEYLYYIEGTGSYYLPGGDSDIFFNLGNWYRRSGGSWFKGKDFEGPWSEITADDLPKDLIELPEDFTTSRKLGKVPYRYVVGPDGKDDDGDYQYYRGRYYNDYRHRGYRRHWDSREKFWFYTAPYLHDED